MIIPVISKIDVRKLSSDELYSMANKLNSLGYFVSNSLRSALDGFGIYNGQYYRNWKYDAPYINYFNINSGELFIRLFDDATKEKIKSEKVKYKRDSKGRFTK